MICDIIFLGDRMAKKNNSKKIEEVKGSENDLFSKLYIVMVVLLFFGAFYLLTLYITNKNSDSSEKEEEKTVEISKDNIILGRSLDMSKDDYFVIYYDKSDESISSTYDSIVNSYSGSIYTVDMSNSFNKKYATTGESNKSPSKVSEFLINGPTLIKVSNKKVVSYVEGEEAIRSSLN